MPRDDTHYVRFIKRQNLDKFSHSLEGVVRGIAADGAVGAAEVGALRQWLDGLGSMRRSQAFAEITNLVERITEDGVVQGEELDDLRWLLDR